MRPLNPLKKLYFRMSNYNLHEKVQILQKEKYSYNQ